MKRTGHPTVEDARRELVRHGYYPLHQRPEEIATRWRRLKSKRSKTAGDEFVIRGEARPRSKVWHIESTHAHKESVR